MILKHPMVRYAPIGYEPHVDLLPIEQFFTTVFVIESIFTYFIYIFYWKEIKCLLSCILGYII